MKGKFLCKAIKHLKQQTNHALANPFPYRIQRGRCIEYATTPQARNDGFELANLMNDIVRRNWAKQAAIGTQERSMAVLIELRNFRQFHNSPLHHYSSIKKAKLNRPICINQQELP